MAIKTNIEWADHTWSPWRSCQHAELPDGTPHPGCLNCYAEAMARRNPQVMGTWGPKGTRVRAAQKSWDQVRKWNKDAWATQCWHSANTMTDAIPPRIFPSVCDPFEDWSGPMHDTRGRVLSRCQDCRRVGDFEDDFCPCGSDDVPGLTMADCRRDLFGLIDETDHLTWILLTKRPHNIRRFWPAMQGMEPIFPGMPGPLGQPQPCVKAGARRGNVWLLYSASDQCSFDAGIGSLIDCKNLSAVIGVCLGPLIGPIDLRQHIAKLDWVIIEGESGPNSRPNDIDWTRDIIAQCQAANVPCFHKQLGAFPLHHGDSADARAIRNMKHPKGGDMSEWPEDLRVRQFPDPVPF